VFNNEVDSYRPWILFLIFASMMILISGVVLLTHKKPERSIRAPAAAGLSGLSSRKASRSSSRVNHIIDEDEDGDDEEQALRNTTEAEEGRGDQTVLWQVGDDSDDEDDRPGREFTPSGVHNAGTTSRITEEGSMLMRDEADFEQRHEHSRSISSDATLAQIPQDPFHDDDGDDDFGQWK